jgi:hypothetical protein
MGNTVLPTGVFVNAVNSRGALAEPTEQESDEIWPKGGRVRAKGRRIAPRAGARSPKSKEVFALSPSMSAVARTGHLSTPIRGACQTMPQREGKNLVCACKELKVFPHTSTMDEIPEIPLIPSPKTPEARRIIGFASNRAAGKAHKIGGEPDWIQNDETPECSHCFQKMTFYGQLDCLGDIVPLGDCGRIFVFVCFDCLESRSVMQCS